MKKKTKKPNAGLSEYSKNKYFDCGVADLDSYGLDWSTDANDGSYRSSTINDRTHLRSYKKISSNNLGSYGGSANNKSKGYCVTLCFDLGAPPTHLPQNSHVNNVLSNVPNFNSCQPENFFRCPKTPFHITNKLNNCDYNRAPIIPIAQFSDSNLVTYPKNRTCVYETAGASKIPKPFEKTLNSLSSYGVPTNYGISTPQQQISKNNSSHINSFNNIGSYGGHYNNNNPNHLNDSMNNYSGFDSKNFRINDYNKTTPGSVETRNNYTSNRNLEKPINLNLLNNYSGFDSKNLNNNLNPPNMGSLENKNPYFSNKKVANVDNLNSLNNYYTGFNPTSNNFTPISYFEKEKNNVLTNNKINSNLNQQNFLNNYSGFNSGQSSNFNNSYVQNNPNRSNYSQNININETNKLGQFDYKNQYGIGKNAFDRVNDYNAAYSLLSNNTQFPNYGGSYENNKMNSNFGTFNYMDPFGNRKLANDFGGYPNANAYANSGVDMNGMLMNIYPGYYNTSVKKDVPFNANPQITNNPVNFSNSAHGFFGGFNPNLNNYNFQNGYNYNNYNNPNYYGGLNNNRTGELPIYNAANSGVNPFSNANYFGNGYNNQVPCKIFAVFAIAYLGEVLATIIIPI